MKGKGVVMIGSLLLLATLGGCIVVPPGPPAYGPRYERSYYYGPHFYAPRYYGP